MNRFAGKTAIVTGASRGIGLGIAERLVRDGARVVITARNKKALDEAVELLGGPAHALAVEGKADDTDHQDDTIRQALEAFGSVDFLVNNTGINPTYGPMIELGLDIRVNGVAPAVVKTKFGSPLYEGREDQVSQAYPLKRLGVPEDIGSAVAFLLSDDAGWLTGQTLVIDGGVTLTGGVE
jgi:NAD(P)-dependent dehydrogenase (short-subunit alcohol dehydrogenase family)